MESNNMYTINKDGTVVSPLGKQLVPFKVGKKNIQRLAVTIEGKTKQVSRLVAEAHIPNIESKPLVLHKDDDTQNNHVDNLYWGTYQDNWNDKKKNGWVSHPKGVRSKRSKLSGEQIQQLLAEKKNGGTYKELMARYKISKSTLAKIVKEGGVSFHT